MSDQINFADDAKPEAPPDTMAQIAARVKDLRLAQRALAAMEEVLKEQAAKVRDLEQKVIPDLMASVGMLRFTTLDGAQVEIVHDCATSITKAHMPAAYQWLRDTNNDSIIRHTVGVKFGKGNEQPANELAAELIRRFGADLEIIDQEAVHPQTLKAFVKECLRDGVDVPRDLFGVYEYNRTVVKEPHNEQN